MQIKLPVKTYEPLQVTEEEFVANIEARATGARRDEPRGPARSRLERRRSAIVARIARRGGRRCIERVRDARISTPVVAASEAIAAALAGGGKVLVFGNGGSAADAQHLRGAGGAVPARAARRSRPSP